MKNHYTWLNNMPKKERLLHMMNGLRCHIKRGSKHKAAERMLLYRIRMDYKKLKT